MKYVVGILVLAGLVWFGLVVWALTTRPDGIQPVPGDIRIADEERTSPGSPIVKGRVVAVGSAAGPFTRGDNVFYHLGETDRGVFFDGYRYLSSGRVFAYERGK